MQYKVNDMFIGPTGRLDNLSISLTPGTVYIVRIAAINADKSEFYIKWQWTNLLLRNNQNICCTYLNAKDFATLHIKKLSEDEIILLALQGINLTGLIDV